MIRKSIDIEKAWRFSRDEQAGFELPEFDDREWDIVDIPHDWAIKGPFSPENDKEIAIINTITDELEHYTWPGRTGGLPHIGKGFYRREFDLPDLPDGAAVRLEIDGIMSNSQIYCNGRLVGGRPYGYSSFALELAEFVRPGKNVIAVAAENIAAASRWYPGAGIYRHIRLLVLAQIHIDHWGIRVTTENNKVRIKTAVKNQGQKEKIELVTEFFYNNQLVGSDNQTALVGESHQFSSEVEIPEPKFWSPNAPFLYKAVSSINLNGETIDRKETILGLRDIVFHPRDGFFINGEKMPFKGVCMHHDLGPLGAAVNTAALRRQLSILQTMGCNAIRTVHNPPAPDLLELCDEMGFLVIDEAFDEWEEKKSPNGYNIHFEEWAERDLRDMIRRDANHPCVIMWSIGNEISEQYRAHGTKMAQFLCDICHDEDPSRPTTAGLNDNDDTVTGGLFDAVDVHGFNYKPYIYSIFHHRHPARSIYSSESASTVSTRGEYHFPVFEGVKKQANMQLGSFDLGHTPGGTTPDHEFKGQDENPFVMGEFVWTGFDYLGEPTPYREEWPARSSYYGIMDLCGIPKDRFYLYQSRWTNENVLHLMPHWTWPEREGETLTVQCYSSSRRVELFVNGVSQGIQTKNPKSLLRRYRLVWPEAIYEPGELRAAAIDDNGQVCNEKIIRTAGNFAQIKLSSDRTCIKPDGRDMAFITVELTDESGYLCPDADNLLDFSVSGPAEIVACGNGDPSSLENFTEPKRRAFHGKCVVYLRSKPDADNSGLAEIILSAKTNIDDESFSSSVNLQSSDCGQ